MQRYQPKAEKFVEQYRILKETFPMQDSHVLMYASTVFINAKKVLDTTLIEQNIELLKQSTTLFSRFRGSNTFRVAIELSIAEDAARLLQNSKAIYQLMVDEDFKKSGDLPIAALYLAKDVGLQDAPQAIEKAKAIFDQMNKRHFWLTGTDDYIYACLLAASDLSIEAINDSCSYYYNALSGAGIKKNNALQSVTHVLTLGQSPGAELVNTFLKAIAQLDANDYHVRNHVLPIVALLTIIGKTPSALIERAIDLSNWLKQNDYFGEFDVDANIRLAIAAAIITDYHANDEGALLEDAVLNVTIKHLIMAQSIAIAGVAALTTMQMN